MAIFPAFQDTRSAPSMGVTVTMSVLSGTLEGMGMAVTGAEGLPSQVPSVGVTVKT